MGASSVSFGSRISFVVHQILEVLRQVLQDCHLPSRRLSILSSGSQFRDYQAGSIESSTPSRDGNSWPRICLLWIANQQLPKIPWIPTPSSTMGTKFPVSFFENVDNKSNRCHLSCLVPLFFFHHWFRGSISDPGNDRVSVITCRSMNTDVLDSGIFYQRTALRGWSSFLAFLQYAAFRRHQSSRR